jgi:hypothetical protein
LKRNAYRIVPRSSVVNQILGPGRVEVTGEWRKLNNKELNDLYCSANVNRAIKSITGLGRDVACVGLRGRVYWVLVGKPEGKRTLGGPKRRWEDNIKMDL